ncbi:hypothetical protein AALB51_09650 [Lachnospiraceae bacterium 62-26]
MKCPICGQELKPGKKDPNYLLCYNCKKKFKVPQKKIESHGDEDEEEGQKYSNIPPKQVRKKREAEMRQAYDEMLAAGDGSRKKTRPANPKPKRREEIEDDYDDDYYDDEDDEKMSKLPIIILGIAIVIVAALIIFVLLK